MNAPLSSLERTGREQASGLAGPLPARRKVRKAVILAAGRGRRMGGLTAARPKAALEVGDHALLDWQIRALQAAGVEEIAVVTGHAAQALAGRGVAYIPNPNWSVGTQVETLLCAREWIGEEPVIVSYSDILYQPCAPLALLERPGDIVIAYDADHRWLWKARFGDWLRDSETFRLAPGQVLAEIGGKPTAIETIDGQFMGLMLLTPGGLDRLADRFRTTPDEARRTLDFTRLLGALLADGVRIDTAANLLPWMEIDAPRDLRLARAKAAPNPKTGGGPQLNYPGQRGVASHLDGEDQPDLMAEGSAADPETAGWDDGRLAPYAAIRDHRIDNVFAIQNWGRSGSTLVQSLFDDHPQVLSTPNFYARRYFMAWSESIAAVPDGHKIETFLGLFRQWWDSGLVDATAGLHRLGPGQREIAGVRRERLEGYLRAAFATGRPITRRSLFEAAHIAYALARGQALASDGLQILFPVHGEPRGVACALLEDYPQARFVHTVRDPASNLASLVRHFRFNACDFQNDPLEGALQALLDGRAARYGQLYTAFGHEPYLAYLGHEDQVRFLKLEDLHRDGATTMAACATWLGLRPDRRLTVSTWDGKLWWNRPESGGDTRPGRPPPGRGEAVRMAPPDHRKIEMALRRTPYVRALYSDGKDVARHGALTRLTAALRPWRQEALGRRAPLRAIATLLGAGPLLPRSLSARLIAARERERFRGRLLQYDTGAVGVRRKLADERKPGPVRALLLVQPAGAGWRVCALAGAVPAAGGADADRLAVCFVDQAAATPRLSDHAFWILVLGPGWSLCQVLTAIRLRWLMVRLLLAPAPPSAAAPVRRLGPTPPPHAGDTPHKGTATKVT